MPRVKYKTARKGRRRVQVFRAVLADWLFGRACAKPVPPFSKTDFCGTKPMPIGLGITPMALMGCACDASLKTPELDVSSPCALETLWYKNRERSERIALGTQSTHCV